MISVQGVSKTYRRSGGDVRALDNVSIEVPGGDFVVVCGQSGCGKTTLLLSVGGLLAPDSGTITVDGKNPYTLPGAQRAMLRARTIGYVFQQFHLVPYLSVRDNVLCPALAAGLDGQEPRADELIGRFNLADRRDHLPGELSTGEKQRVALARAMLNAPKVILADEPTGNLDEDNARIVIETLRDFAAAGGAVMMVTHERQWADYGREIRRMAAGKLVHG